MSALAKRMTIKKVAKGLGVFLLAALLTIMVFAIWVLNSESGLRWALNRASDIVTVANIDGDLGDLSFTDLQLSLDDTAIEIESGKLKWSIADLLAKRIKLEDLRLKGLSVHIDAAQTPDSNEAFEPWQGIELPIEMEVDSLTITGLSLANEAGDVVQLDDIQARLSIVNDVLTVDTLRLVQDENTIIVGGKLDLTASAQGKVQLNNRMQWSANGQRVETHGNIDGTWQSFVLTQNTEQPLGSKLNLVINDILSDNIAWIGSLNTQAKMLSNRTEQILNVGQGDFKLSGEFSPSAGLAGLIAKVSGSVSGDNPQLSSWAIATDLEFANDTLSVRELTALEQQASTVARPERNNRLKQGQLNISGSIVGLTQFLDGSNGAGSKADLQGTWHDLAWPLDQATKQITTSGGFTVLGVPENFSVTANATGTSYQKPIIAKANIQVVGKAVDIKTLTLNSGASRINVVGKVGEQLALEWDISSPNLSELLPGISGDLLSQGELSGAASAPNFIASAQSQRIVIGKTKVNQLTLSARGSLSEAVESINLDASVSRVAHDANEVAKDLAINVIGTGEAHTISANSVLFGQSILILKAQGELSDKGWLGSLYELSLDDPSYQKWSLAKPVNIKREGALLTTDRACLTKLNQNICVSLRSDQAGLVADGEIRELELNNVNPLLGLYDINASGQLNGSFNYNQSTKTPTAQIRAELKAQDSTLTVKPTNGAPQSLAITSIDISLDQQQSLNAQALVLLENDDRVSAELSVASAIESPDFNKAKLEGRIITELGDLSKFQAVSAPLSDLQGSLNTNITLGGSIAEPSVGMRTRLQNGQVEIPDLGLSLREISLNARSVNTQKVEIEGGLISGQGKLDISGELDFASLDKPRFTLSLKGDNLALMKTPEVHVDGNIDTAIVITRELVDLTGSVSLLQADLDFQLPENAILASEDVVLLGEEEVQQSVRQKINLTLNLGKQTHIQAQGLDAYLVGRLEVLQEPDGIMRASGQIDIKDGRYAAYNQKLKIDKGQLIYNGGAIDDPSLLIRAQKSVDNITAGVSVTGRASAPLLQLYSTPSMSDQDVLSVLIFDKRIGDLGSQDGLTLLRIANSLRGDGTSKSQVDVLTENIQESLGLTDLELQLSGNTPSLVAGKQLSNKFYIGYGYGLLDAAQSLILRYKINQAWSIQGDVGADSGADLRYQIER